MERSSFIQAHLPAAGVASGIPVTPPAGCVSVSPVHLHDVARGSFRLFLIGLSLLACAIGSSPAGARAETPPCKEKKIAQIDDYLRKCSAVKGREIDFDKTKLCLKNEGLLALKDYLSLRFAGKLKIPLKDVDINPSSRDADGTTILCYAISDGDVELTKFLLGSPAADINTATSEGITPLMMASRAGDLDLVRNLISRGASINAKDGQGTTAVMYAAAQGSRDVVTELLKNFADARATDRNGRSALFFAGINNRGEIVKMLEGIAKSDMDFAALGVFYSVSGNPALALQCLDSALSLNPRNELAWFTRGSIHHNAGSYEKAIESYRRAVSLDATKAYFWYNLAILYLQTGDYRNGIETISRAIALKPDSPAFRFAAARLQLEQGDAAAAVKSFEKTHTLQLISLQSDTSAENFNRASWYSLFVGEFDEAEAYAKRALAGDERFTLAYSNLGHALMCQVRREEALHAYRKFLHENTDAHAAILRNDFQLLTKRYPFTNSFFSSVEQQLGIAKQ